VATLGCVNSFSADWVSMPAVLVTGPTVMQNSFVSSIAKRPHRGSLYVCCLDGPASAAERDDGSGDEDAVLAALPGTWYEVVYPVQVHAGQQLFDLDTRDHRARHKVHYTLISSFISIGLSST